ncbi:MAG: hypothetical protein N2490_05720 [Ignavibacteria bacterium]|nr:hypothetical protein [Ignavibacteria bacterium]
MFYYKIFDDCGNLNYFKSSLPYKELDKCVEEFKNRNNEYINEKFFSYLKEIDKDFEEIEVNEIFY